MEDYEGKKIKHKMGTVMRACDRAASVVVQEKRQRRIREHQEQALRAHTNHHQAGLLRSLRAAERELLRTPLQSRSMNSLEDTAGKRSTSGELGYFKAQLAAEKKQSNKFKGHAASVQQRLEREKEHNKAKVEELKAKANAREAAQSERSERLLRIRDAQYMSLANQELEASTAVSSLRNELAETKETKEREIIELEAQHEAELAALQKQHEDALAAAEEAREKAKILGKRVAGYMSGNARAKKSKVVPHPASTTSSTRQSERTTTWPTEPPEPVVEARHRFDGAELRRHVANLTSRQLARALGTDTLRELLRTKEGDVICMEFAEHLKSRLESVWDQNLAIEMKCVAGCSDSQMDELRRAFSLVPGPDGTRAQPRTWYKSLYDCKGKITFPSPIRPRSEWYKLWTELCAKHNIESTADGEVSQRSFGDVFDLVIKRNLAMAYPGAGLSADFPLDGPIGSADAVSWGHKLKVTHGGLKFSDFKPGFSAHSEWNYVTAMLGRMDDGHESQQKLCGKFALDFGEAMKRGYRDVSGIGRVYFKGGMCTDMAFTRAALGRRAMSSPHCECGKDRETRQCAIHEPYTMARTSSYETILAAVQSRCKLFSMRRCFELTHTVPPDHDWSRAVRCSACPREDDGSVRIVFRTKDEADAEFARLLDLQRRAAAGDVDAKKAMKKELDKFAELHYQFSKYKAPVLWVGLDGTMLHWRQDVMHGINLNIAKADFKYSWLDGATGAPHACAPAPLPIRVSLHESASAADGKKFALFAPQTR